MTLITRVARHGLRQSHFPRCIDFNLCPKPGIQNVEHLHRSFESNPEILIPFIPGYLQLVHAEPLC